MNLQYFSTETGGGGGYAFDPEQFADFTLEEGELGDNPTEPTEGGEEGNSGENGEGNTEPNPNVFDLGELGQVDLDTLKSWKDGHLMQSDYTKKTQELAEQRRQLEEQFNPYKQLDELFATNPELERQVVELIRGQQQPNPQQQQSQFDINQHPQFQQMQQQLQQQQQYFQQMQQEQMRQQMQQEMEQVKQKFPDVAGKEQELAAFADENGLKLEQAYMIMNFNNVKQQTQQEMVKNNMKKKAAGTVKPQNNTGMKDTKNIPQGNYNELVNYLMKQDLNLSE